MRRSLAQLVLPALVLSGFPAAAGEGALEVGLVMRSAAAAPAEASVAVTLDGVQSCADGRAEERGVSYEVRVCRQGGEPEKPVLAVEVARKEVIAGSEHRERASFTLKMARGGTAPVQLGSKRAVTVTVR